MVKCGNILTVVMSAFAPIAFATSAIGATDFTLAEDFTLADERGLSPAIAIERRSELSHMHGEVCAAYTDGGALVVTIGDTSPIYRDGDTYPVQFRVAVRVPGAGAAKVETDARCEVVSRSDDELVFWTETEKDTALFFRLGIK